VCASQSCVSGPSKALWLALLLGIGLRVVLLKGTAETPLQIEDERHYHQLAVSLLHGRGYSSEFGPTSMRPPVYPALLAGIYAISGEGNFQAVRVVQIGLLMLNVLLLYRLGTLAFDRRVAAFGAGAFWLYPSLIGFEYLLLTEVLFTLLLTVASLAYISLLRSGRAGVAVATGAAFGLAALARSILWPFPLILCPLTYFSVRGPRPARIRAATLLFLGFALVIGPWAVRNMRLQGVFTVVDTMGGLNLMMGNYEHTPLERPWDAISLQEGEKSWAHQLRIEHPDCATWSEGRKEKWATKRALEYMAGHPGQTTLRSLVKLCDFWGLERVIIAGLQKGLYAPPKWFAVAAALAITVSYVGMMLLASLGFWFARPLDARIHAFFAVVILHICGLHCLAFGHSRYHLPLVPILILYASSAVVRRSWREIGSRAAPTIAFLVTAGGLVAIWAREVFVRDFDLIKKVIEALI
jgi:hypothetical protein